jgi:hypothetical protein
MQYLVDQKLPGLLGAGLLGVIVGWIWWGRQLRQSRERAADFEQRAAKLSGYPARLTDMEATHAAYVASKNEEQAKQKARIAEIELLAAQVTELKKNLDAKNVEADGGAGELAAVQAKLSDLELLAESKDAEIAEHVQAHQDKDARLESLSSRLAELDTVAKRVPGLERQIANRVDAQKEEDEHMEELIGQVDDLKAAHADKDAKIAELARSAEMVPDLKAQVADRDLRLDDLKAQLEQQAAVHADKDAKLAELAPLEGWAPDLKGQLERQVAIHREKDAKIVELAAAAALVPALQADVQQHQALRVDKDAKLAELAAQVEELQTKTPEDADLRYEHELLGRKLRMAELALVAHQSEIAKLNDQLLARPVAAAPVKVMAAAAGAGISMVETSFYDFTEGQETQEPAPQLDHASEFEKRLEERRNVESAKDAEIAGLRSKIAEIEAAPDLDARRQILFAAKNAEVTQLKGVLNTLLQPINSDDVAKRAYQYAEERGFQGGSEKEDWLRAERDVHHQRLASAWESTRGGGTMY